MDARFGRSRPRRRRRVFAFFGEPCEEHAPYRMQTSVFSQQRPQRIVDVLLGRGEAFEPRISELAAEELTEVADKSIQVQTSVRAYPSSVAELRYDRILVVDRRLCWRLHATVDALAQFDAKAFLARRRSAHAL